MEKIYTGKTKDVYKLQNGNILLKFKDDATGIDGVFDPGANTVGLSIAGLGRMNLELSTYFFSQMRERGVDTHFVSADLDAGTMEVLPVEIIGKGLEVICRYRAVGSFMRRYADLAKEGQKLDALVETTLKDDERGDPFITADTLEAFGIMTVERYDLLKLLTKKAAGIVRELLAAKGAELYDIKFEFGISGGKLLLIDEISSGNMRVYKDGEKLEPKDIAELFK